MKNVGILTFEKWHAKDNIGSSKIRAKWLINHWNEAEIFQQGKKYDVTILQKVYWLEYLKAYDGIKILDICDPDWMDTVPVKGIFDLCDAIVTSTEALAEEIRKITDTLTICIPDRVDLDIINVQKKHVGIARKIVWFGYSQNVKVLDPAITAIKKRKLKLTVISNQRPSYTKANLNIKFDESDPDFNFNECILNNDFVILPENTNPRSKFKSNNKTITSWSLGMPVATTIEDLDKFMYENEEIGRAHV